MPPADCPRVEQVSWRYLPLCQQVLAAVQRVAREGAALSRDTWETLLLFLLHVSDVVLAPPSISGEQQCNHPLPSICRSACLNTVTTCRAAVWPDGGIASGGLASVLCSLFPTEAPLEGCAPHVEPVEEAAVCDRAVGESTEGVDLQVVA